MLLLPVAWQQCVPCCITTLCGQCTCSPPPVPRGPPRPPLPLAPWTLILRGRPTWPSASRGLVLGLPRSGSSWSGQAAALEGLGQEPSPGPRSSLRGRCLGRTWNLLGQSRSCGSFLGSLPVHPCKAACCVPPAQPGPLLLPPPPRRQPFASSPPGEKPPAPLRWLCLLTRCSGFQATCPAPHSHRPGGACAAPPPRSLSEVQSRTHVSCFLPPLPRAALCASVHVWGKAAGRTEWLRSERLLSAKPGCVCFLTPPRRAWLLLLLVENPGAARRLFPGAAAASTVTVADTSGFGRLCQEG